MESRNKNDILRYNITFKTWDFVGEMKYNRSFHSASLVNAEDMRAFCDSSSCKTIPHILVLLIWMLSLLLHRK